MNKKKIVFILLLGTILLGGIVVLKLFVFGKVSQPNAALQINSIPKTKVFLNDKEVGEIPLKKEKMEPGDYKLKLVTLGGVQWETKIKLLGGVFTYVYREVGETLEDSSGQIITMEALASDRSVEVAIVSDPDGAFVGIDGVKSGSTSTIIKNLEPGDHTFVISSPDYSDQIVYGNVTAGYRMNIVVKLKKNPFQKETVVIKPTSELIATNSSQLIKPYVVINQTPIGFLRVRSAADPTSSQSGTVYPGEKYSLLEELNSWTKIKLATMSGWVSDQYIEKVK